MKDIGRTIAIIPIITLGAVGCSAGEKDPDKSDKEGGDIDVGDASVEDGLVR